MINMRQNISGYRKPAASVGSMNTAGMASIIVLMDGSVALEENIS